MYYIITSTYIHLYTHICVYTYTYTHSLSLSLALEIRLLKIPLQNRTEWWFLFLQKSTFCVPIAGCVSGCNQGLPGLQRISASSILGSLLSPQSLVQVYDLGSSHSLVFRCMVHRKGWDFKLAQVFSNSSFLCIHMACLHSVSSFVPAGMQAPPTQGQASFFPCVYSVQHAERPARGVGLHTYKLPPWLCQWESRDVPLEYNVVYRLAPKRSCVTRFREFLGREEPR